MQGASAGACQLVPGGTTYVPEVPNRAHTVFMTFSAAKQYSPAGGEWVMPRVVVCGQSPGWQKEYGAVVMHIMCMPH